MILGHQSGVMHYTNGRGNPVPPAELANDSNHNKGFIWALEYIAGKPLVDRPRQRVSYTTFGFNLLGAVIERAGKKSLEAQVREAISEPLGLETLQPDYEWKEIPRRAVGYQLQRRRGDRAREPNSQQQRPIVRQGSNDVSWKLPGGGFISTVEDLAGYCGGLMGEKVLPKAALEEMWTRQSLSNGDTTGYGFSFRLGEHDGHRHVSHGGSQEKTKTFLNLSPDDGVCVVVMSNSVNANPRKVAQDVEDIYRKQIIKTALSN